jgi:hypothetical protein
MSFIECPDGVVRSYAEYEDSVKSRWKGQMAKEQEHDSPIS